MTENIPSIAQLTEKLNGLRAQLDMKPLARWSESRNALLSRIEALEHKIAGGAKSHNPTPAVSFDEPTVSEHTVKLEEIHTPRGKKVVKASEIITSPAHQGKPEKPAKKAPKAQGARQGRRAFGDDWIVTVVSLPPPKKHTGRNPYDAYKTGRTVAQCIEKGAKRRDVNWDVKQGHIKVAAPKAK